MKILAAILATVLALALAENYLAHRADAVDIDMKPAACYVVEAYSPPLDDGTILALIFNQCDPSFAWKRVPKPPDHEV